MTAILKITLNLVILLATVPGLIAPVQAQNPPCPPPTVTPFVSGLGALYGTTVGPDGALYVAERSTGSILRVDPQTGDVSTFASGLPTVLPEGGPYDVAFIGDTAYVLETLVGSFPFGGDDIVGIYRIDGPDSFTVIADIGQFAMDNPPIPPYVVPEGVPFAMQVVPGGFLVTDGHHNRVYFVTLGGEVSEVIAFENIVPTGLEFAHNRIYMAEAGPVPHLPENGKIIRIKAGSQESRTIASGAPLMVDVELGRNHRLYGLSQGDFPEDGGEGEPALPNTGSLVVAHAHGFTTVASPLNQPTSFQFIGDSAYVVGLGGEIVKIDNVFCRPNSPSN